MENNKAIDDELLRPFSEEEEEAIDQILDKEDID